MRGGSPKVSANCPGVVLDPASVENNIVIFELNGTGRNAGNS
jgi:hypothetical protein